MNLPAQYSAKRSTLGFDDINCGFGGIRLFPLEELAADQATYSLDAGYIVVGIETACGDPIFVSEMAPHAVFTAIHGEGSWTPTPVAPSIDAFWNCLEAFREFSKNRDSPAAMEGNPPDEEEIDEFLPAVKGFCDGDEDAAYFWALATEIEPVDDYEED